MDESFTSFLCANCQTEIEASLDMIGSETECPACGSKLIVPDNRDDGVVRHTAEEDKSRTQMLKSRTIRIELEDDL